MTIYNLRFTNYDLRFTNYDLRFVSSENSPPTPLLRNAISYANDHAEERGEKKVVIDDFF